MRLEPARRSSGQAFVEAFATGGVGKPGCDGFVNGVVAGERRPPRLRRSGIPAEKASSSRRCCRPSRRPGRSTGPPGRAPVPADRRPDRVLSGPKSWECFTDPFANLKGQVEPGNLHSACSKLSTMRRHAGVGEAIAEPTIWRFSSLPRRAAKGGGRCRGPAPGLRVRSRPAQSLSTVRASGPLRWCA